MICFPNCKINLGLNIVEKRNDGFHNIESIFYPVPLNDILEIVKSEKIVFTMSGNKIQGPADSNLCIKAYRLLQEKYELPPINIHLHKVIPTGAGLGGGSSNAAFMIKLINSYFSLNMSIAQMQETARNIGSDCAFFIENKPVLATQKGDTFKDCQIDLTNYHIMLVKPNIHVSTPEAYSLITPKKTTFPLTKIQNTSMNEWKECINNDFEKVIFEKHPEIKKIKERLYEMGAIYSSMSGSGSCVYGIFDKTVPIPNIFNSYFTWQGLLNQSESSNKIL